MRMLLLLGLMLGTRRAVGQSAADLIVRTDSTRIQAKVMRVGTTEIEYHRADNPGGPVYSVKRAEVAFITYANGTRDIITAPPAVVAPTIAASSPAKKNAVTSAPTTTDAPPTEPVTPTPIGTLAETTPAAPADSPARGSGQVPTAAPAPAPAVADRDRETSNPAAPAATTAKTTSSATPVHLNSRSRLFNPGNLVIRVGYGLFDNVLVTYDFQRKTRSSLPLDFMAEVGLGLGPHRRALWSLGAIIARRKVDWANAFEQGSSSATAVSLLLLHHRAYTERFDLYWGIFLGRIYYTDTYYNRRIPEPIGGLMLGFNHGFSPRLGCFAQAAVGGVTLLQLGLSAKL